MTLPIVLIFTLGTILEIFSLKLLSDGISIVNTFSEIMLSFLIGIFVGRSWGNEFYQKIQSHLKSQSMPEEEIMLGATMAFASTLLITPGVITDIIGLLIIIPITRSVAQGIAESVMKKRIALSQPYFFFKP